MYARLWRMKSIKSVQLGGGNPLTVCASIQRAQTDCDCLGLWWLFLLMSTLKSDPERSFCHWTVSTGFSKCDEIEREKRSTERAAQPATCSTGSPQHLLFFSKLTRLSRPNLKNHSPTRLEFTTGDVRAPSISQFICPKMAISGL